MGVHLALSSMLDILRDPRWGRSEECYGEHELREIHLPTVQSAVKAGVRGVMAAYNEIDGIYCHANRKLLTEMLRGDFKFDGIVMADALAVDQLNKMTGDGTASADLALRAGVDVGLLDEAYSHLEEAVEKGLITEDEINQAVHRVS